MWPTRRVVGESVLLLVVVGLSLAIDLTEDAGVLRTVATAALVVLLTSLRRVLPATVLVVTAALAVLPALTLLVLVAAWSAGRRIDGARRTFGVFALAYVLALASSSWEMTGLSLPILALGAMMQLFFILLPGLAGRYLSQRRTLADILGEYHAQLLREREIIAEHARIRERQRIAQDMHDSLGHQLALIAVHTGALEVDRDLTDRQREAVGVLREASAAAMHELRDVVGVLRDGVEAPSGPAGAPGNPGPSDGPGQRSRGVAGIEGLVESSRKAGAVVELRTSGDPRPLGPAAGHAAYRLVQEGLTNAHKHAPGARISVGLRYEPDSLVVEVANGPAKGPAPHGVASGGQGLTGLEERARLVGGMVHAGPTEDGGFRLAGVLPYAAPADGPVQQPPPAAVTTFVAPVNDLRGQSPAGPLGQSDRVLERIALPKELAKAMNRDKRRKGFAIGCGVAALVGVLLLAGLVVGGVLLFREAEKSMIEPKQYDAVEVGTSEAEVRDRLPSGDSFLMDGLDKGAPPEPQGAECITYRSTEMADDWDKEPVFRFCFKDGTLIEKKSFEVSV
ncbi:sensor histidine kinase [Streptomyces sp. enrichment culture]|uniref:sensor histidine kinase n=1 Tax=Streptomyces sp. enrichment culture TaxID=1795815 RepID=UPI003F54BA46